MGLIRATYESAKSVLQDQWKDYFYCDALTSKEIVKKARAKNDNHPDRNIISDRSIISVADGQCALIVEQGEIVEVCAEPGEFVFDRSTEPSLFSGSLNQERIKSVFNVFSRRVTYDGHPGRDQKVYYVNTKEFTGNLYGTPAPVPFRVVDKKNGLDLDITIKCFGEYSYKIMNPILFYKNVCGNVEEVYLRESLDSQLKSELLTSLQKAFSEISKLEIRYSMLPQYTDQLRESLNEILSERWRDLRGIEIVSFGISSIKASEKDEDMIKEIQRNAVFKDPLMAAAQMVGSQSIAIQEAAKNQNAGAAMAFMGLNMANGQNPINAQELYKMAQNNVNEYEKQNIHYCSNCGHKIENKTVFCPNCGHKLNN